MRIILPIPNTQNKLLYISKWLNASAGQETQDWNQATQTTQEALSTCFDPSFFYKSYTLVDELPNQ
jgi:hypothetical protein